MSEKIITLGEEIRSNVVTIVVKPRVTPPPVVEVPDIEKVEIYVEKDGERVSEAYEDETVTVVTYVKLRDRLPSDATAYLTFTLMKDGSSIRSFTRYKTVPKGSREFTYRLQVTPIKADRYPYVTMTIKVDVRVCIGEKCKEGSASTSIRVKPRTERKASLSLSAPSEVREFETFNVLLTLANSEIVKSIPEVRIEYSSTLLDVVDVNIPGKVSEEVGRIVITDVSPGGNLGSITFRAKAEGVATISAYAKVVYLWDTEDELHDEVKVSIRRVEQPVKPSIRNVIVQLINDVEYDASRNLFIVKKPGVKKLKIMIILEGRVPENMPYAEYVGKVVIDGVRKDFMIKIPSGVDRGETEIEVELKDGKTYTMTVIVEDVVQTYTVVVQAVPPPVPTPPVALPGWVYVLGGVAAGVAIGSVVLMYTMKKEEMKS